MGAVKNYSEVLRQGNCACIILFKNYVMLLIRPIRFHEIRKLGLVQLSCQVIYENNLIVRLGRSLEEAMAITLSPLHLHNLQHTPAFKILNDNFLFFKFAYQFAEYPNSIDSIDEWHKKRKIILLYFKLYRHIYKTRTMLSDERFRSRYLSTHF